MRVPLTLSIAGPTIVLGLLTLWATETRPPPLPPHKPVTKQPLKPIMRRPPPRATAPLSRPPCRPNLLKRRPPRLAHRKIRHCNRPRLQMMRGAQLPPFPAGVTASQIEVSVTIRSSLTR
jgi:hypothetical protein